MKTSTTKWESIIRKYLGEAWVKNEMAVLDTMTQQQRMLPISVEQARAQVLRLKEQSQSAVKKGQNSVAAVCLSPQFVSPQTA